MKDENKMERKKLKFGKSTLFVMVVGGVIGGLYGIGGFIAGGLFRSWSAVVPFAPSFTSFILLSEGLGLKNDNLVLGINIVLWTLFGMLVGFIINRIIIKIKCSN